MPGSCGWGCCSSARSAPSTRRPVRVGTRGAAQPPRPTPNTGRRYRVPESRQHLSAAAPAASRGGYRPGQPALPAPAEQTQLLWERDGEAVHAQAMVLRGQAAASGHAAQQRARQGSPIIQIGCLRFQTPPVPHRREARVAAVSEYLTTFVVAGAIADPVRANTLRCGLRTAASSLPPAVSLRSYARSRSSHRQGRGAACG